MGDLMRLGVAAMDRKARSKPMRNILSRLLATNRFEIIVFGDKVILDEEIESWPVCDFLITFFSSGFPMDKAMAYVALRQPICINNLPFQKIFWDRRMVSMVLDAIGVRTPEKIEVNRDGGPKLDPKVAEQLEIDLGIKINTPRPIQEYKLKNEGNVMIVGDKTLEKSFVEKPWRRPQVSTCCEELQKKPTNSVYIYFSKRRGGGGRKLFRKIGNKSSEHESTMSAPRTEGSYIYEKFMDIENAEDIKVYTIGPNYAHAETRKSPVVDGVVRRNEEGKEIRYKVELTDEEKRMACEISKAFKQNVCGFDLIRANGKSYVIDVNGWSFVKGSDDYYQKCAEM